jgi:5-hydroxyisourate hydrolase-like protein (transthyretin family)
MSLSVQVINAVYGMAAAGVTVRLDHVAADGGWTELDRAQTDEAGGICPWQSGPTVPGAYRLEFHTDSYFASLGITPFYLVVTVEFRMPDPGYPHHARLLLAPSFYLVYWVR